MKDLLTQEYSKAWKTEKMIKHCVNSVSDIAVLNDGSIVTIHKPHIETRFCFGESGYDMDDAVAMAKYARESQDYFIGENIRESGFDMWISQLDDYIHTDNPLQTPYAMNAYYNQNDDCRLKSICFYRYCDFIPSGNVQLSREDAQIILDAYKSAKTKFEKRLRTYLKRYGLTKVHTWTYWRDA